MFSKMTYIFIFCPSPSHNTCNIVAGLCVDLKGLWQGVINESKLNIFIMDTSLDQAKDAWCDPTHKCMMIWTYYEQMANALQVDKELIFPVKKAIINLKAATLPSASSSQGGNDLLSTSSVSTFRTTSTMQMHTMCKNKWKVKLPPMANTISSSTSTMLSASTFDEKDINCLLNQIMQH